MKHIIEQFDMEGLRMGRLLSSSKSAYREKYPDHEIYFNANVFSATYKIWYGDLDITLDSEKLDRIAENLGEKLYVIKEMDGRFEKEDLSEIEIMKKAVYVTR